MPCKEFLPQVCDSSTTRATICASSQNGYIAATVTVNRNCSFQYSVYLEQWNEAASLWMNIASRSGLASTSGTNHSFNTDFIKKQTFRVRCKVLATNVEGVTAPFDHL